MKEKFYLPYENSENLQYIVESINDGRKKIVVEENSLKSIDSEENDRILVCPGLICKHSKMNVWKIAKKLEKANLDTRIVINGCRFSCIKLGCDIEIICTVGGFNYNNQSSQPEILERVKDLFSEERSRGRGS